MCKVTGIWIKANWACLHHSYSVIGLWLESTDYLTQCLHSLTHTCMQHGSHEGQALMCFQLYLLRGRASVGLWSWQYTSPSLYLCKVTIWDDISWIHTAGQNHQMTAQQKIVLFLRQWLVRWYPKWCTFMHVTQTALWSLIPLWHKEENNNSRQGLLGCYYIHGKAH